jgi:hypothetical protein
MVTPKEVIEEDTEEAIEEDTGSSHPEPEPSLPLALTPPPPKVDNWKRLAEHYGKLPFCRAPKDRTSGHGEHLVTLLTACEGDYERAANLLDWWAYSNTDRALFLRYGKPQDEPRASSTPAELMKMHPKFGLATLTTKKNRGDYLSEADDWKRRGSPRFGAPAKPRRNLTPDELMAADNARLAALELR